MGPVAEPANRLVRYPLARALVRLLMHTPVTPNQVTLIQPVLAAGAGGLFAMATPTSTIVAVVLFEIRSVLDCADGTLARAKNMVSDTGHAMDGFTDWICVIFVYLGISARFVLHPPAPLPLPDFLQWVNAIPVAAILAISLLQGAFRSFASDYYIHKYGSIFATGQDASVEALRERIRALPAHSTFFQRFEIFIGQAGQFFFEHRLLHPEKTGSDRDEVASIASREHTKAASFVASIWGLSNGDAFLTLVMISAVFDQLWAGQVFFATLGLVWLALVLWLNRWFTRAPALASVPNESSSAS
jgi:phosphatidylglycerophosphate synthase